MKPLTGLAVYPNKGSDAAIAYYGDMEQQRK
jgi:hypothetical protein